MAGETQGDQGTPQGFAGLVALIPDGVAESRRLAAIADRRMAAAGGMRGESGRAADAVRPSAPGTHRPAGRRAQPVRAGSEGGNWHVWGIAGAGLIVFALLAALGSRPRVPAQPGRDAGSAVGTPKASSPNPRQPAQQTREASQWRERMPAGGGASRVLTVEELRWCLAEKLRIDASDPMVDAYSASEVARFNQHVDVLNQRCGSARYYERDMAIARRGLEGVRQRLEEEGRARFGR